jgi:ABC-type sugar transport system ATPase subunit
VPAPCVEFDRITKRFGGTKALDAVTLSVALHEVHALVGENGAGKSTLGRILGGIHRADEGTLRINGRTAVIRTVHDARDAGIGIVHQELALCRNLTVAENLCLGRMPGWIFLDGKKALAGARTLLADIAPEIDVHLPLRELSIAQCQLVQVAAAIGTGARILVFDEPTSSLTEADTRRLMTLVAGLRAKGFTIIYVSHRMEEVFELADTISVLRDGRLAGTLRRSEATEDRLVRLMIGRPLEPGRGNPAPATRLPLLRVEQLSSPGRFDNVSLTVGSGEILGIAGLVGAGRSEVASALFGLDAACSGSVTLDGKQIASLSVRGRMDAGLAYIPEDRKLQGLALELSCRKNFSLTIPEKIRSWFFLNSWKESRLIEAFFGELGVKAASPEAPASSLSGGNQQKIVLAKWLARRAKLYILDEPTRGIDVGAKAAIHGIIRSMAEEGAGILLISSELPELLALSHRIAVMRGGKISGEMPASAATQEGLIRLMSGGWRESGRHWRNHEHA